MIASGDTVEFLENIGKNDFNGSFVSFFNLKTA